MRLIISNLGHLHNVQCLAKFFTHWNFIFIYTARVLNVKALNSIFVTEKFNLIKNFRDKTQLDVL